MQILIYNSDPEYPDASDIAKATDYIVAYACKGVETIQEEKNQMISLVLQSQESFASSDDVKQIARKLLNKTIANKMISKQEAMVLVGQLSLVDCSESISTVSISGHYKLDYNKKTLHFCPGMLTVPSNLNTCPFMSTFIQQKTNQKLPPKQKL